MKATKKPVTIDYVPYEGCVSSVREWVEGLGDNFSDNFEYKYQSIVDDVLMVKTLEGTSYEVTTDDMIIRGINLEYYPCKKDIFYKTYDVCSD